VAFGRGVTASAGGADAPVAGGAGAVAAEAEAGVGVEVEVGVEVALAVAVAVAVAVEIVAAVSLTGGLDTCVAPVAPTTACAPRGSLDARFTSNNTATTVADARSAIPATSAYVALFPAPMGTRRTSSSPWRSRMRTGGSVGVPDRRDSDVG